MNGDALTTKELVKDRLGITATTYDSLLNRLILSTTARIQQMTGRRFIHGTYTNELHDGCDAYRGMRKNLILKNGPVDSIATVEYNNGTDSAPSWVTMPHSLYTVDLGSGIINFFDFMPFGYQNVRVTYVGGFSGFTIGINTSWVFNRTPGGLVDGNNLTFTLPEAADQIVVYVDGARELVTNVTHTNGTITFTLAAGRAPYSTIAVDYVQTIPSTNTDNFLPEDLVDVCERAVVYLFKMREAEGKKNESFNNSSIAWRDSMFTDDMRATIRSYRRGYNL